MRPAPLLLVSLLLASGAAAAPAAPVQRPAHAPGSAPASALGAAAPPGAPAPFTAASYVMGSSRAPVTVVEYLSAGCTHCAEFDIKDFPRIKARYIDTGKVRWEVRELLAGPVQLAAAGFVLARCTGRDRYWPTLEAVFRAQDGIFKTGDVRAGLLAVAHGAGLTDGRFDACMADDAAFAAMNVRSDESLKAGVRMTPTFFVNGRKYETDPLTPAEIDKALAAAPRR